MGAVVEAARRLTSSRSTEAGWCLTSAGGEGIASVLRANVIEIDAGDAGPPGPALAAPSSPPATKANLNCA